MAKSRNYLSLVKSYKPSAEEANWLNQFDNNFSAWAALYYALMFNSLDYRWIKPFLSPDVSYASQSVSEELRGIKAVGDYLSGKISALKLSGKRAKVLAELGAAPDRNEPCVIFYQAHGINDLNWQQQAISYVVFTAENQKIEAIFMISVVPSPQLAKKTNLFPAASLNDNAGASKLPAFAELEFRVYLMNGEVEIDKKMLEAVEALSAAFPHSRTRIIRGLSNSSEDFDECCERGIVGFPVLIIEWQSEQLLRFDGLQRAETLIKAVAELF